MQRRNFFCNGSFCHALVENSTLRLFARNLPRLIAFSLSLSLSTCSAPLCEIESGVQIDFLHC